MFESLFLLEDEAIQVGPSTVDEDDAPRDDLPVGDALGDDRFILVSRPFNLT